MIVSPPLSPSRQVVLLCQVYQDAARSAELCAQEVAAVTGLVLTLFAQRGVDREVLAAAVAEQAARTGSPIRQAATLRPPAQTLPVEAPALR